MGGYNTRSARARHNLGSAWISIYAQTSSDLFGVQRENCILINNIRWLRLNLLTHKIAVSVIRSCMQHVANFCQLHQAVAGLNISISMCVPLMYVRRQLGATADVIPIPVGLQHPSSSCYFFVARLSSVHAAGWRTFTCLSGNVCLACSAVAHGAFGSSC